MRKTNLKTMINVTWIDFFIILKIILQQQSCKGKYVVMKIKNQTKEKKKQKEYNFLKQQFRLEHVVYIWHSIYEIYTRKTK